jgi:hypothetical protein
MVALGLTWQENCHGFLRNYFSMIPGGYSPSIMENQIELVGFMKSVTLTSRGCYALHKACWVFMLGTVLSKCNTIKNIRIFCILWNAPPLFVTFFPMVLSRYPLGIMRKSKKTKFWRCVREEGVFPDMPEERCVHKIAALGFHPVGCLFGELPAPRALPYT